MMYEPTIIGIADSTHYLVGRTDNQDNFDALPQLGSIAQCSSLSMAKSLLIEHNVHCAQLTLQTAYDEMCGLPACEPFKQTINF